MLKGFKEFILKGNVVDMAVGVVIAVAFGNVVTAVVESLITPLISVVGGGPDLSGISFSLYGSEFRVGSVFSALISFFTVAAVVYFFVVVPMNKMMKKISSGKSVAPTEKTCPECLSLVPIAARRCRFCTSPIKK